MAVWIQGSERLEGTVAESELAVIVILNDRGVGLPSPLEEARAALQRHGHANRKLMRRCDINQSGVRRQRADPQALVIDRNWLDARACGSKRAPRRSIPRNPDHTHL